MNYYNNDLKLNWALSSFVSLNKSDRNSRYEIFSDKEYKIIPSNDTFEFDIALYDTLSEAYTVVGLDKLALDKKDTGINIKKLKKLDDYHSTLMFAKKIFYENVISFFLTSHNNTRLLLSNSLSLLNEENHSFEAMIDLLNILKATTTKGESLDKKSKLNTITKLIKMVKELKKSLIFNLLDMKTKNKLIVDVISKTISLLNDIEFSEENFHYFNESKVILFNNLFILMVSEFIQPSIKSFENFVEEFDKVTVAEQTIIQNMIINIGNKKYNKKLTLENDIKEFISILQNNAVIDREYVYGRRCFATMQYYGEKYYALSGLDYSFDYKRESSSLIEVCNMIEKNNYKRVRINENMKYYYYSEDTIGHQNIKYVSYEKYLDLAHLNSNLPNVSKLFTCCERKLLTMLNASDNKSEIFVKYFPCIKCDKALNMHPNVDVNYLFSLTFSQIGKDINYFENEINKIKTYDSDISTALDRR